MEHGPFESDALLLINNADFMVIFHSYVKFQEASC